MSDTPINITIEELHIHVDEIPTFQTHDETPSQDIAANSESSTEHLRGPRGAYEIKDRPVRGLMLEELEASDGVTVNGLADLTQAKRSTVRSDLYHLMNEFSAVRKLTQSDGVYFVITETGRRILAKYREQWSQGRRNLPKGFLEGFRKNEP